MILDKMVHFYDIWDTIVIAINFLNEKKMNCTLVLFISNHYGIICLSNQLLFESCSVMLKVISDILAIGMIREIQLLLQLISAMQKKWFANLSLS